MSNEAPEYHDLARGAALLRLRQELLSCMHRAEALGLTAIAIYLQRAVDEIGEISA